MASHDARSPGHGDLARGSFQLEAKASAFVSLFISQDGCSAGSDIRLPILSNTLTIIAACTQHSKSVTSLNSIVDDPAIHGDQTYRAADARTTVRPAEHPPLSEASTLVSDVRKVENTDLEELPQKERHLWMLPIFRVAKSPTKGPSFCRESYLPLLKMFELEGALNASGVNK